MSLTSDRICCFF